MNEISNELVAKYFEGIASEEEKRVIIRWCNASEENKRVFLELKEIWQITGNIQFNFEIDTTAAWEKVTRKIDNEESVNSRNLGWYLMRVAAIFLIGFLLYSLYEFTGSNQPKFDRIASADTKKEVYLPDGSKVWLNNNSSLEYVREFEGETRYLKLDGEAYFEVKSKPDKPFIIETEFSRIRVLGTSFNYRAYSNQNENFVIVNSGKVEFSDKSQKQSLILVKGEEGKFNFEENSMKKSLNNEQNYLAWQTGVLVFEDGTFEEIISDISDFYSQKFVFNNSKIKSLRLTVTFDNEKLENVLNILERTIDVTFLKSSDKIIIK
jgi:transmembrane sensor